MEELRFTLPVFEGPLDLLLHLVQKHKLSLTDIPVALICEQYLTFLDKMAKMDMEITGEFLSMAAHLLYMKSRVLLPAEEDEEEEDPKAELEERLRLYKAAKEAAGKLEERQFMTIDNFFKAPETLGEKPIENEKMELAILWKAFLEVTERLEEKAAPPASHFKEVVQVQRVSLADRITYVSALLGKGKRKAFRELFEGISTKDGRIATFLAVLHLVSRGRIRIEERKNEVYLLGGKSE